MPKFLGSASCVLSKIEGRRRALLVLITFMASDVAPERIDLEPAAALYAMRRDPIGFFTKLTANHGDFVRFSLGAQDVYLLNHPELIKDVLVTNDRDFTKWFAVDRIREVLGDGLFVSEGEFHSRQRRLLQPAFHRERIASYAETMVKYAFRLRDQWQSGDVVDICREMN
jgi:cytochrome P450